MKQFFTLFCGIQIVGRFVHSRIPGGLVSVSQALKLASKSISPKSVTKQQLLFIFHHSIRLTDKKKKIVWGRSFVVWATSKVSNACIPEAFLHCQLNPFFLHLVAIWFPIPDREMVRENRKTLKIFKNLKKTPLFEKPKTQPKKNKNKKTHVFFVYTILSAVQLTTTV